MRAGPRFQTRRGREIAVALAMFALLLGSLGGAYALTTARASQLRAGYGPASATPEGRRGQTLQVMGLQLTVPASWQRDPAMEQTLEERTQTNALASLADPDRPERSLSIIRARMDVSPEEALNRSVTVLVPESARVGLRHVTQSPQAIRLPTLIGRQYIGYSQTAADAPADVYLVATLTRDGEGYWVLLMTDRSDGPGEQAIGETIRADVAIFLSVLRSAGIQVPAAVNNHGNQR